MRRFRDDVVAAIRDSTILVIKAGAGSHRTIGIWAVVVAGLKDAVDRADAEKYKTPGSLEYVRGFKRERRRATTTELVPDDRGRSSRQ